MHYGADPAHFHTIYRKVEWAWMPKNRGGICGVDKLAKTGKGGLLAQRGKPTCQKNRGVFLTTTPKGANPNQSGMSINPVLGGNGKMLVVGVSDQSGLPRY